MAVRHWDDEAVAVPERAALHRGDIGYLVPLYSGQSPSLSGRPFIEARGSGITTRRGAVAVPERAALHRGPDTGRETPVSGANVAVPERAALHRGISLAPTDSGRKSPVAVPERAAPQKSHKLGVLVRHLSVDSNRGRAGRERRISAA